jgi:hypothetical protein
MSGDTLNLIEPTHFVLLLQLTAVLHSFLASSPHFSLYFVEKLSLPQKANLQCSHKIVETASHCQRFKFYTVIGYGGPSFN